MAEELSHRRVLLREVRHAVIEGMPSAVRRRVRQRLQPRRVLEDLDQVDEVLAEARGLQIADNDAYRRLLDSVELRPPAGLPPDPTSDAYRDYQLDLYAQVSGRGAYQVAAEASAGREALDPRGQWPYSTGSTQVLAEELLAAGFFFKALDIPRPARVLELGGGWGQLTHHLVALGHDVTTVDINPVFGELISRQCERLPGSLHAVTADMLAFEPDGPYDAIIFDASFHHCPDHLELLRRMRGAVAASGAVYFVDEPIYKGFWCPWGLRLDGISLAAIRENGWLELGFERRWFMQALARTGWSATRLESAGLSHATHVTVARPA